MIFPKNITINRWFLAQFSDTDVVRWLGPIWPLVMKNLDLKPYVFGAKWIITWVKNGLLTGWLAVAVGGSGTKRLRSELWTPNFRDPALNILNQPRFADENWLGMDPYLQIPFLGGWTSIYQLFWWFHQGYKVLTHCQLGSGYLNWGRPNDRCRDHLAATKVDGTSHYGTRRK